MTTKILDALCAWLLLSYGAVTILMIETKHPPGAVLDLPILWIYLAMFNLLRIRNAGHARGIRSFCVAANLIDLMVETVRWKMFGQWVLIGGILVLCETAFSLLRPHDAETTE